MRMLSKGVLFHNLAEALVDYRIPGISKRDQQNWKYNFQIKLKYFSRKLFFRRVAGLMVVATFILIPKFMQSFFYKIYINK
jgi:hypothetical protein